VRHEQRKPGELLCAHAQILRDLCRAAHACSSSLALVCVCTRSLPPSLPLALRLSRARHATTLSWSFQVVCTQYIVGCDVNAERDNVVYWKTNRKIINDLQCMQTHVHIYTHGVGTFCLWSLLKGSPLVVGLLVSLPRRPDSIGSPLVA